MGKIFAWAPRECELTFFDADPVTVKLLINDETDKKIETAQRAMVAADKGDINTRAEKYRSALVGILGDDVASQILSRCPEGADAYACYDVFLHVRAEYFRAKQKNLYGSR